MRLSDDYLQEENCESLQNDNIINWSNVKLVVTFPILSLTIGRHRRHPETRMKHVTKDMGIHLVFFSSGTKYFRYGKNFFPLLIGACVTGHAMTVEIPHIPLCI